MGLSYPSEKRFYKPKNVVELSDQQVEDLLSAVNHTRTGYPKDGAEEFIASLGRIEKKLWKILNEKERRKK